MKEKRILRLFGQIDDKYIEEAETQAASAGKHRPRRAAWMSAVAAVLVIAVLGGTLFGVTHGGLFTAGSSPEVGSGTSSGENHWGFSEKVQAASYEPDYTVTYNGEHLSEDYLSDIRTFAANSGLALLDGTDTTAYSPTALYTALSMVAELAEGDSQDALLDVLGVESTDTLRQSSGDLWRYLCTNPDTKDPGKVTIANSMWLNQDYVFNGETLQNLADYYYVSSYTGDMTKDIPTLVSKWVKKQTNDLLDCQIKPDNDTMAVLLSAIYFYDEWAEHFNENATTEGRFRVGEDEWVKCNYMQRTQENWGYYQGEGVTASVQYFQNGGKMLFILPDEDKTPNDVLENTELMSSLLNWEALEKPTAQVEWSIPRFTLKKTLDLEDGLTALGLGELFDKNGNPLSLLSGDGTPAYIGQAEQGTAISIDEVGCEAASYVKIEAMSGSAMPPEDLIEMSLNRPFVFAILSENDVPLFLGVVSNPNG
jgi:serine protease inhibitor